MVSSSSAHKPQVYGLQCKACGGAKSSITMELCSKCEQAMLLHYPIDYFKSTSKIAHQQQEENLELTAYKVLEALELASQDAPTELVA